MGPPGKLPASPFLTVRHPDLSDSTGLAGLRASTPTPPPGPSITQNGKKGPPGPTDLKSKLLLEHTGSECPHH